MKATVWLWPIITTLLCASQFVCTAQRGEYGDFEDSTLVQNDFLLEKRLRPSLSIVNPLDVLRQRLMLETARRQQREQNRQVEINRQILKQVGKRKGTGGVMTNNIFDFLRQNDHKVDLNDDIDDNIQTRYFYSLH